MRLARRTALLVALYLLTSAGTAHAECAWVMWGQIDESHAGARRTVWWDPESAYPSDERCKLALQEKFRAFPKIDTPEMSQEVIGNVFFMRSGSGSNAVTRTTIYRCLPDTVDPRGPKANPR